MSGQDSRSRDLLTQLSAVLSANGIDPSVLSEASIHGDATANADTSPSIASAPPSGAASAPPPASSAHPSFYPYASLRDESNHRVPFEIPVVVSSSGSSPNLLRSFDAMSVFPSGGSVAHQSAPPLPRPRDSGNFHLSRRSFPSTRGTPSFIDSARAHGPSPLTAPTAPSASTPVSGCEALTAYVTDMQRLQEATITRLLPQVRASGVFPGLHSPPVPPKSAIRPFSSTMAVDSPTSTVTLRNNFGGMTPHAFPTFVGPTGVPHPFLRGYRGRDRASNNSKKRAYYFVITSQTLGRWQQEPFYGVMPTFHESWAIMSGLHSGASSGHSTTRDAWQHCLPFHTFGEFFDIPLPSGPRTHLLDRIQGIFSKSSLLRALTKYRD